MTIYTSQPLCPESFYVISFPSLIGVLPKEGLTGPPSPIPDCRAGLVGESTEAPMWVEDKGSTTTMFRQLCPPQGRTAGVVLARLDTVNSNENIHRALPQSPCTFVTER